MQYISLRNVFRIAAEQRRTRILSMDLEPGLNYSREAQLARSSMSLETAHLYLQKLCSMREIGFRLVTGSSIIMN